MSQHNLAIIFWTCFCTQWKQTYTHEKKLFYNELYHQDRAWTARMFDKLHRNDGFLDQVIFDYLTALNVKKTRQFIAHEWYTIDALGGFEAPSNDDYTQSSLSVLVEHENGKDVETEMWKLSHWKVPLKVLVFYNHATDRSADWLKEKLAELHNIQSRIDKAYGAKGNDKYLFIIGSKDEDISFKATANFGQSFLNYPKP
jgi:hypothetical protein